MSVSRVLPSWFNTILIHKHVCRLVYQIKLLNTRLRKTEVYQPTRQNLHPPTTAYTMWSIQKIKALEWSVSHWHSSNRNHKSHWQTDQLGTFCFWIYVTHCELRRRNLGHPGRTDGGISSKVSLLSNYIQSRHLVEMTFLKWKGNSVLSLHLRKAV